MQQKRYESQWIVMWFSELARHLKIKKERLNAVCLADNFLFYFFHEYLQSYNVSLVDLLYYRTVGKKKEIVNSLHYNTNS